MKHVIALAALAGLASSGLFAGDTRDVKQQAADFLAYYNGMHQSLSTAASEAEWVASTDVTEAHTGERIGARKVYAAFAGHPLIIETTKRLLAAKAELDPITVRQLEAVLLAAAEGPGTIPDVVKELAEAEGRQSATLDGYTFHLQRPGQPKPEPVSANDIDDILRTSKDLAERKAAWLASKEIGGALKPGLIDLQRLRNRVAREMGYSSFFALQVADYGMTVDEMMALLSKMLDETRPLYRELHYWARTKLASQFGAKSPKRIPAHWLGNRWAQTWPGLVEGVDLDRLFEEKSATYVVRQAERFYVSLGFPSLPKTFWERSDLYPVPASGTRKKNSHASAWHIDLDHDVRSLMSVEPNFEWFGTAHHELGHIYYYLSYSRPEVPPLLREGANRAFHEAIGDLIAIAAGQVPYLRATGLLPEDVQVDKNLWLLNEALDTIVFIPWSAGVMSSFEHDLYETELKPDQWNKRWWELVQRYQGVDAPEPRDETQCDAATKTHINDDAAQYYDYALAFAIKYQLHDYIARNILHQDPRNCNYYGNKEVGRFLRELLEVGRTVDWRTLIRAKTGEDISTRAMLDYFAPVMSWLKEQNHGADTSFD
jgi:peptidyl-dipeptidase A